MPKCGKLNIDLDETKPDYICDAETGHKTDHIWVITDPPEKISAGPQRK